MTSQHLRRIPDRELVDAVLRAASTEREATVELLGLLGEFDERRLYLGEGCSSLFSYCTQVLHLSEHAAYHRIEGARVARQFPRFLELLSSGALTLTTLALLRPIPSIENAEVIFETATFKTKREVELQVARLVPRPDAPSMVRRIPEATSHPLRFGEASSSQLLPTVATSVSGAAAEAAPVAAALTVLPRPTFVPLSSDRFLLRLTVSAETHAKLRRAQDLLRHSLPSGDPAAVIARALTMLVDHLERAKTGKARQPRPPRSEIAPAVNLRHIPRAVRRAVWQRGEGRCTFIGAIGRCTETAWLEFHHIVAFARGGPTEVANLTLRCRAHNQFDGQREFGPRPGRPREKAAPLPLQDDDSVRTEF